MYIISLLHVNRDHDGDDEDQEDPTSIGWYKLMLAQVVTGPYVVRAEILVVTVLVSPVRVVRVELGVQVGLEDVGVVEDTDEAEKVETEVPTRARGRGRVGRCGLLMMFFFARSNTTIKRNTYKPMTVHVQYTSLVGHRNYHSIVVTVILPYFIRPYLSHFLR